MADWTETAEMQIWNPDYAFAFPDLNINAAGEVGVGVAFDGASDLADAAFGIIGDFVVWYQNASDAALSRWATTSQCAATTVGGTGSRGSATLASRTARSPASGSTRSPTLSCSRGNRRPDRPSPNGHTTGKFGVIMLMT